MGGSGGNGDGCGIVRRTSGFLVGRIWTVVTTVAYGGTLGSFPYESRDDGEELEFLTRRVEQRRWRLWFHLSKPRSPNEVVTMTVLSVV